MTTPRDKRNMAFTLFEMLIVVSILAIVLALITRAWHRAKWTATIIKESAVIRSKLDDALIRGAIKPKDYEFYREQIQRQIKTGLSQNPGAP